ncbi:MAG: hypothetical protein ABI199_07805 [Bacteroidia bacterium]
MSTNQTKPEKTTVTPAENKKGIENHKKAATHLEAAAKSHLDAAKHHEAGNHEKAAQSTVEAHGHTSLANDCQKEDAKYHASKN